MCGVVGILAPRIDMEVDRALLERMNESQHHRGPDEGGMHLEPGLGLGHRRLSIIDLSSGQQPLFNEDGTVVVVFNGEIYNFQELSEELIRAGHQFRTRSDTEVIVHAWEQWGEHCVTRFRGMFAFAVWDRSRQTLFVARDRLGIKPLYYTWLADGTFLFGSELKALLENPHVDRALDPEAVEEYFAFGYVPEPRTILKGVHKLSPGHSLLMGRNDKGATARQYWDVVFATDTSITEAQAQEELVERLREAVRIRLISEVPLGAFLSGGVDSSSVVAMMAGLSERPVTTCSISFGDPAFDEASFSSQVAARYKTDHHVESVDSDDFSLIDKLADLYDEPFADSSAIPTYRVCELARKHVTVALSGDGGDENLAGYRRYRWHAYEERMRRAIPLALRRAVFGGLAQIYPKANWAPRVLRAKATFEAMARDSIEGYMHGVSILSDRFRRQMFTAGFRRELQGYSAVEVLRRHSAGAPGDDPVSMVQYLDIKTYLAGDILTKVDRASMAHALEVRVPILDHQLVEWFASLPVTLKLANGEGKYILKRALRAYLSDDILYRRKMGFAVPLAKWFRGPLRERMRQTILGEGLESTGLFDRRFLEKLVDQHVNGGWDHSPALWSLLMFAASHRRLLGEAGD